MRWIKVETHLVTKREIIQLASLLGISRHEAVGLCIELWSWADIETEDGWLPGCTAKMIDGIVGRQGFAEALSRINWLTNDPRRGLFLPNFERHNGKSTKRRLAAAERQFRRRNQETN